MKAFVVCVAITCSSLASMASSQSAPSAGGSQTPQPNSHPVRVRVKLDGFDLTPQSTKANQVGVASPGAPAPRTGANQIGGASRGIGAVKLFAPPTGLAYSLHPTFQWSGSPDTKYKLEFVDLADHTTYSAVVEGTTFTYPEIAPALKAGSTYSWKVESEIEFMGGASDAALIVIAGGKEREGIEAALAAISQTGLEGERARAKVYFDKRAWYDAASALSILISAHPDDRELRKMRGALYDQVPATEKLADADFSAAQ